ncbi:MAG: hypothetical protein ACM3QX_04930 [Syntrophomonadaceae bacterium]
MKLEEKITGSGTSYIHSMDFNHKDKKFTLILANRPEFSKDADKKIIFSNVSNFHIDEETNSSVDQVMGIGEYKENDKMKYVLLTEQRTILFFTDKEPLLTDLL